MQIDLNADRDGRGPIVLALGHSLCADATFTCADVALLARASHLIHVPPSIVLVGTLATWVPLDHPWADEVGMATIRGWLASADGTAFPVGPVFFNVHPSAVDDVLIELAGFGRRASSEPTTRLVVLLQSFVPADVSLTVAVDGPGSPIRITAVRGIDERVGPAITPDMLVLSWPELAVLAHGAGRQSHASVAADGGTASVEIPDHERGRAALRVAQAIPIARDSARLIEQLRIGLELDFVLWSDQRHLLICRPN